MFCLTVQAWCLRQEESRGNFEKLRVEAHIGELWFFPPESLHLSLSGHISLLFLEREKRHSNSMADALKAEGNKAFSAKDYPTAMYVSTPRLAADGSEVHGDGLVS